MSKILTCTHMLAHTLDWLTPVYVGVEGEGGEWLMREQFLVPELGFARHNEYCIYGEGD